MDQISENNRFPDGATVCFIEDSITWNNLFLAHIAAYYRSRFPESGVAFYNCGIAGAGLKTLLARLIRMSDRFARRTAFC